MARTLVVALAGTVLLTVGGCTTTGAPPAAAVSSSPPTAGSELPEPVGPNDVGAQHASPLPYPTDDPAADADALEVATEAMIAFARPGLDADTWWAQLAPWLSPGAQAAYAGTDPDLVPASAVTGPAVAAESPSTYLATVTVPTDVGDYVVLLAREGAGAPWLVERLTPPPALGTP